MPRFFSARSPDQPFTRETHPEAARAQARAFLKDHVLPGGVGAEIGVFWAHFSEVLLAQFKPRKLYLVDAWHKMHGETFRNWGPYTNHGTLPVAKAKVAALALEAAHGDVVEVVERYSGPFLRSLADETLDWVYLDARHTYEAVSKDLASILPKLKQRGVIMGDDYSDEPDARHPGVRLAVDEFAAEAGFELVVERKSQYVLRRKDQQTKMRS